MLPILETLVIVNVCVGVLNLGLVAVNVLLMRDVRRLRRRLLAERTRLNELADRMREREAYVRSHFANYGVAIDALFPHETKH